MKERRVKDDPLIPQWEDRRRRNTGPPDFPSPDELVAAFQTIVKLHRAIGIDYVRDMDGKDVWEGLVEGKRMVAVGTKAAAAAMLRFLRALGELLGAVGFWGSLPIFAFIVWCMVPRRGP